MRVESPPGTPSLPSERVERYPTCSVHEMGVCGTTKASTEVTSEPICGPKPLRFDGGDWNDSTKPSMTSSFSPFFHRSNIVKGLGERAGRIAEACICID